MPEQTDDPAATPGSSRELLATRPWTASYDDGVAHDIDLPETSLIHMLERSVAVNSQRVALEFFGARWKYSRLGAEVERVRAQMLAALAQVREEPAALAQAVHDWLEDVPPSVYSAIWASASSDETSPIDTAPYSFSSARTFCRKAMFSGWVLS